jgi:uracil-DNA glycosylase
MIDLVPASWRRTLEPVVQSAGGRQLDAWLEAQEAAGKQIFPPRAKWFRAFELTPLDAVRAVILGQDPYHGPGQAQGLAFSVGDGIRLPPSLANIFKELGEDLAQPKRTRGDLSDWAGQGVLLLNTALTVEAGQAGSHAKRGWQAITDAALAAVSSRGVPTVFILWGNHARRTGARILPEGDARHLILESAHPSPLSAYGGFFGSRPFSKANHFLVDRGLPPVRW